MHTVDADHVDTGYVYLRRDYVVGGSCTTGMVGQQSNGELLQCVNSRWSKPGGNEIVAGGVCNNGYVNVMGPVQRLWGGATCIHYPGYLKGMNDVVCPSGSTKRIIYEFSYEFNGVAHGGRSVICQK